MAKFIGGRSLPAASFSMLVLCIRSSNALIPKTFLQHQPNSYGVDAQSHRQRHHIPPREHQLRASAAASPPPPGGGQHHPPQRAVNLTPLGMLDSAIIVPAVSPETRDDAAVAVDTGSSGAPVCATRERRETSGDGGKEEREGGEGGRRPERSRSRSVRQFCRRKSSHVLSFLTIMTTWILFRFLLKGLNKVECHNRQALLDAVLDRGDRGLLTVSNHMCVYDDPGLWSALVPFWRTGRKKMRWALCTDDIYYANPVLSNILHAGRTMPIKRTRGMEQPLFKNFFQKLEEGEWGHIFAEGAIRQPWRFGRDEPILADFKAGIGRLLLRSEDPPLVLPIYHIGMHQIASETPIHKRGRGKLSKILPNVGRKVRVYVGEPIDVTPIIAKCRERIGDVRSLPWTKRSTMEEVACHREIAAYVREHVLKLEEVARRDYYGTNPDTSPYATVPA
eukprot:g11789.t1